MESTITPVTGTPGETVTKNKKKTTAIPADQLTLSSVANTVAKQWADSTLTLQWITAAEFTSLVNSYADQLSTRNAEKGTRPQLAKQLHELDKKIDQSLEYVKNYISDEVQKEKAPAYYAQFGIQRSGTAYRLPAERQARLAALKTLQNGLVSRGYSNLRYGTAFWQPIVDEYATTLELLAKKDTTLAGQVGTKETTRDQVKKVLNALIHVIRGNYPDTYVAELRKWGFQKEKY